MRNRDARNPNTVVPLSKENGTGISATHVGSDGPPADYARSGRGRSNHPKQVPEGYVWNKDLNRFVLEEGWTVPQGGWRKVGPDGRETRTYEPRRTR